MSTNTTTPEYTFGVSETGVDIHWPGPTLTIEPEALRLGGWEFKPTCDRHHCDDGDCPECTLGHLDDYAASEESPLRVLERWHADAGHFGALRHCDHEPCKGLVIAMGQRW